jgi:hypothetical protein
MKLMNQRSDTSCIYPQYQKSVQFDVAPHGGMANGHIVSGREQRELRLTDDSSSSDDTTDVSERLNLAAA